MIGDVRNSANSISLLPHMITGLHDEHRGMKTRSPQVLERELGILLELAQHAYQQLAAGNPA